MYPVRLWANFFKNTRRLIEVTRVKLTESLEQKTLKAAGKLKRILNKKELDGTD